MEDLDQPRQIHDGGGIVRLKLQQEWLVMILLLLLVPPMKSQDTAKEAVTVTGKWTVSIQGQRGPRTQKMTLQQDGNKISGSVQGRWRRPRSSGDSGRKQYSLHSQREHTSRCNDAGIPRDDSGPFDERIDPGSHWPGLLVCKTKRRLRQ